MLDYSTKNFIKEDGERYCLLIDNKNGEPLFYPNLFITSQVRPKSSYSTMLAKLNAITVLLRYLDESGIDLISRIVNRDFFETYELDAIRDFCQINFKKRENKSHAGNLLSFKKKTNTIERVTTHTVYSRLTVISEYFMWLSHWLLKNKDKDDAIINRVAQGLKSRRPQQKNRNINSKQENKSLDKNQIRIIKEVFRIDSEINPFKDESVRVRNNIIFELLFHLGLRGGELLSIRIQDFDFTANQLLIPRRADEIDDPRTHQPLVKTLDRRVPVKDTLIENLRSYIMKYRKLVPNANRHDYLLVTHKSGPTQGQPISKSGYKKIMNMVRSVCPELVDLHAHKLRHTWNIEFSELMDSQDKPISQEEQENLRSFLMGWKQGSGTAATYNKRFVKEKAFKAALALQKNMLKNTDSEGGNENEK